MSTDILQVLSENCSEETIQLHLKDRIFDFSVGLHERMHALNTEYLTNPSHILEIIRKLTMIYCMSPVSVVRKFLYEISKFSTLPIELRMDCAITLCDIPSSSLLGLECIDLLFPLYSQQPLICQLDLMMRFIKTDYKAKYALKITELFVYRTEISVEWRYRRILGMETERRIEMCRLFVEYPLNDVSYKILACQNLLGSSDTASFAETYLLEIIRNSKHSHRIRADAADVLLHHASTETIVQAEAVLKELGGVHTTFYENQENVHATEIEKSVKEMIQYLDTLKLSPIPIFETVTYNIQQWAQHRYRPRIVVECTSDSVRKMCGREVIYEEKLTTEEEHIKKALLRIELDRTMFRDLNHTLKSVLCLVYAYIENHVDVRELQKRMLEELIDMAGTCTTGYIHRIVNVLSGFGYSLHISWEDQIIANLKGRLNARLRDEEEEEMEQILEQMTNVKLEDRSAFFRFFRRHISSIREEMYEEFRSFMEDLEWDEYFQKAILFYMQ